MKSILVSTLLASVALPACGKKAEPVPAKPEAKPETKPEAKPETKPEPTAEAKPDATEAPVAEADAAAPAVDPDAAAPAVDPDAAAPAAADPDATGPAAVDPDAAAPAAAAGPLPGYWASLFEADKKTTWDVAETVVKSEMNDKGEAGKSTTSELKGKLTCSVKTVESKPGAAPAAGGAAPMLTVSTIECEGYAFDNGVQEGPMGTWATDGKTLWKRYDSLDEPRIPAEPAAKSEKTEEQEVTIAAGEAPGSWCWKMLLLIGDGGVLETCYDKDKGPTKFFGHGGSAMVDSKVTVTLAP